jgi:ABC-2 type transport system ATP-binding protein
VVADANPSTLIDRLPDRTVSARTRLDAEGLRRAPGVLHLEVEEDGGGDGVRRVRLITRTPEDLVRHLLDFDPGLRDLRVEGARLEDVVISFGTAAAPSTAPRSMETTEAHA